MTKSQSPEEPGKVIKLAAAAKARLEVDMHFSSSKHVKQRHKIKPSLNPDHVFVSRSYLAILEAVLSIIDEELDRVQTLNRILPYMLAISEVEVGALLVSNAKTESGSRSTGIFTAVARQGLPAEIAQELTTGRLAEQLASGQQVWLRTKPLELDAEQALLGRHKLHYLLGLPLQFKGEIVGSMVVGTGRNLDSLVPEEMAQRLMMFAQMLALFLDNSRLRDSNQQSNQNPDPAVKQVAELEQLLEAVMSAEEEVVNQNTDLGVLNALSNEVGGTLQLKAILQKAIEQTRGVLNAKACWCYIYSEGTLALSAHGGLSAEFVSGMQHMATGDGVEGMAFNRNEIILRDGLLFHSGHARRLVQQEGLNLIGAAPLTVDDTPIGVLAVAKADGVEWSARDKRMLASISRQVAQAITNAQKFTEAQEEAQSWEADYNALEAANEQLAQRATVLEQQIKNLRQAERQVWLALAASNQARHSKSDTELFSDEELAATLKKVLGKLSDHEQASLV